MQRTILAFGAHPDDVEIGCAGILSKESHLGNITIVVDLSAGEMGTNGTPDERLKESQKAALVMGLKERINLGMKDRRIVLDDTHIRKVASVIRTYKPDVILMPYYKDRHPDHENASKLIREAIFDAGCEKIEMEECAPHKTGKILYYYINDVESANMYLDISDYTAIKEQALLCHESQFVLSEGRKPTVLNQNYVSHIMERDRCHGHISGTRAAEAFRFEKPVLLDRI